MTTISLEPGRYRHYKGKDYEVIDIATDSETEQPMVVYRTLYGNYDLWVRSLDNFLEEVNTETGMQPRFQFVESL